MFKAPPDEGINLFVRLNLRPRRDLRTSELVEPGLGENLSGQSHTLPQLVSENILTLKIFRLRKYFPCLESTLMP